MTRLRTLTAPLLLGALLALGACSSGGGDDAASEPAAGSVEDGGQVDADGLRAPNPSDAGEPAYPLSLNRPAVRDRAIISIGTITLKMDDVEQARFDLQKVLDQYEGLIADEKTMTDRDGVLKNSRVVVRVPSESFDEVLAEVGALGDLAASTRKAEDVTTQVIDTEVRIRAQEKSLERIEVLLARAQSIRDIVAIEAQLTRRQADLDSLKSQQAWLADQTTMATITVYLEKKPAPEAEPAPEEDRNPFLAGLSSGWHALLTVGSGLATVAGAVLPFAVVLAVLAVPLGYVARRVRLRRPAAPATEG